MVASICVVSSPAVVPLVRVGWVGGSGGIGGYYGASSVNTANWVGPGVTYTQVTVAQYICTGSKNQISGHAFFLSPARALDHASAPFKVGK